jgi:hypothetical protein
MAMQKRRGGRVTVRLLHFTQTTKHALPPSSQKDKKKYILSEIKK